MLCIEYRDCAQHALNSSVNWIALCYWISEWLITFKNQSKWQSLRIGVISTKLGKNRLIICINSGFKRCLNFWLICLWIEWKLKESPKHVKENDFCYHENQNWLRTRRMPYSWEDRLLVKNASNYWKILWVIIDIMYCL